MDGNTGAGDDDLDTDSQREPSATAEVGGGGAATGGGATGGGATGGGEGGQEEAFDYDVALLFSRQCREEEDLADDLLSQMKTVELRKRCLRVIHYSDITFGASIIERPEEVLRRCRFVFVLITQNTQMDKETRYAKNEALGRILDAEKADRRHCVRPLLLQRGLDGALPAGLADVDRVYWVDGERERCAASLARLLEKAIDNDKRASKKAGRPSTQQEKRQHKTGEFSFAGKESGNTFKVKVNGPVHNLITGQNQHVFINMPPLSGKGSSNCKKNKHPVTGCSAVPSQEAMDTVAGQVGSRWRKLGRRLGLSDGEIDTVKLNHVAEGQEEIVYQMLRKWTLTADPSASLSLLAHACLDIGRGDIADKLSLLPQAEEDKS